jgi:hypothetical protein
VATTRHRGTAPSSTSGGWNESAISEALDQGDRAASVGEDSRGTMVRLQRLLDEVRKSGQASS